MANGRNPIPLPAAPLDTVDRRVRSILYTGIARAHLGYVPVNDEFENACPECRGDGCDACNRTGERNRG